MSDEELKNRVRHLLGVRIEEVIDRGSTEKKLLSGKKLIIKLGADPSVSDLHLGHALVLRKLKEFQDLGHRVVFVIGDFTAMIGDPSGRSIGRRSLAKKEIEKNSKTYLFQVGKVLDIKKTEVRKNSEWFSKMKLGDFIGIAAHFSLRRLMDREDFKKRISEGGEVGLNESLYQVLQAYDSVALGADIELGGRDQKVNLLAGRELQKKMGLPEQDIVTMPLLIGTDGSQKMSKSLDNFVGLQDKPDEMFGRVMSIPDNLILHYAELAACLEDDDLKNVEIKIKRDGPYEAKNYIAGKIVELYFGKKEALAARDMFTARFSKKGTSDEAYEKRIMPKGKRVLLDLVMELADISSRSEARRLILGNAVELNRKAVADPNLVLEMQEESTIRIGKKKFFKIVPK